MKATLWCLPLLATVLPLGGCESKAKLLTRVNQQCYEFGFHPGTSDFARCIQKQYNRHEDYKETEIL